MTYACSRANVQQGLLPDAEKVLLPQPALKPRLVLPAELFFSFSPSVGLPMEPVSADLKVSQVQL